MSAFDRGLIIETAGRVGQVALTAGDAVVREARLGEGRRRASDLALIVDRLLKEQGWAARDLTAVVVGLGPGSYTGLRVGLASAKTLAYATGCRVFRRRDVRGHRRASPADVQDHFGRCGCIARETVSPRLPANGSERLGSRERRLRSSRRQTGYRRFTRRRGSAARGRRIRESLPIRCACDQ